MKARLRKDGKTWEARIYLHGKQQSFYGKTAQEAESKAKGTQSLVSNSLLTSPTFQQYATSTYLPSIRHHSKKWNDQVVWVLDCHIFPVFGKRPIESISRHEAQTFLLGLIGKLSRTSVGHVRKVFHAVMRMAEADEKIQRNPIALVKLPPNRTPREEPYSLAEVARILNAAEGLNCYNAILLSVCLGLREGECLGLKWSDFKDGLVYVQRQHGNAPLKTGSSDRRIPDPGLQLAKNRTAWVSPERSARNLIGSPSKQGKPARGFNAAIEKAGVRKLTFHSLRATFATALEAGGCPEGLISALLGHKAQRVTRLYIEDSREIMNKHVVSVYERLLSERVKARVKMEDKAS